VKQFSLGLGTGTAVFSADGRYRYMLTRLWGSARPAVFIGLNPSSATADANDPTITREIDFARRWGCGGLIKANLFGLVSTDPAGLLEVPDPVGPENDMWIRNATLTGSPLICAWGTGSTGGPHVVRLRRAREQKVVDALRAARLVLSCLGRNADGSPCHPLYLPATLRPIPLEEANP
jgi:hypothetical protein